MSSAYSWEHLALVGLMIYLFLLLLRAVPWFKQAAWASGQNADLNHGFDHHQLLPRHCANHAFGKSAGLVPQLSTYPASSKTPLPLPINLRNNLPKNAPCEPLLYHKHLMAQLLSQFTHCCWGWGWDVLQDSWATHVFPSLRFCFLAWESSQSLREVSLLLLPFCGYHEITLIKANPHKITPQTHLLSLPGTRMHHFPRISFTSISQVRMQAQFSSVTKRPLHASCKSKLDIG